jgi:hypothetical protein
MPGVVVSRQHFLVGGVRMREAAGRRRDPFEEAHGRALALREHES